MRFPTTFLAFQLLVMALTINFLYCAAAPLAAPAHDISSYAGDLTSSLLSNITSTPGNYTTDGLVPIKTQNKCYDWETSEKWKDVGGQHSDFVNQAVYDLCQLIAIEAYKGFPAGNTIKRCKEVRARTQDRNYDRSIGISLRYRGPLLQYDRITAGYCSDRMAKAMDCGAGGEFDLKVDNQNLPNPWVSDRWEAKADPNRGNCRSQGYNSDL